jgi:hypothetical protein
MYNDELTASKWALNSAVECHPHTVEVIGSNPIAPTIFSTAYEPCDPSGDPIANTLLATLLLGAVNSASNVVR